MKIARVIGNVVATAHHPAYDAHKMMLVQPESPDGQPQGTVVVAIDHAQAGPGDKVLLLSEGNGARQMLQAENAPVRSVIVGIIDHVDHVPVSA